MNYYYKETKIGYLTLTEEDGALTSIRFGKSDLKGNFILSPVIQRAFLELEEYFEGKRKTFDIKLNPKGTEFQKRVWMELEKIPYGESELRYSDFIAYLSCANVIHAKLTKKI